MAYILKNKLNRPIHSLGLLTNCEKKVNVLTSHMITLVEKGYITATEVKSESKKKTSTKEEVKK